MSEDRHKSDAEIAQRKIFIGGLSYSTDDDKLRKYFTTYGRVQDAVVMKDPVSRRSRGFGFITFFDIDSVDNALDHEPHTIDARKVEAKRAVPRSEQPREIGGSTNKPTSSSSTSTLPSKNDNTKYNNTNGQIQSDDISSTAAGTSNTTNHHYNTNNSGNKASSGNSNDYSYHKIFVGGLHYDTRDADFKGYFEKYGRVITAEVMFNRETHKSRGFGFIVFELESSVDKVCDQKEHVIDEKVVEVKRAIPRSKLMPPSPVVVAVVASGDDNNDGNGGGGGGNVVSVATEKSLPSYASSVQQSSQQPSQSNINKNITSSPSQQQQQQQQQQVIGSHRSTPPSSPLVIGNNINFMNNNNQLQQSNVSSSHVSSGSRTPLLQSQQPVRTRSGSTASHPLTPVTTLSYATILKAGGSVSGGRASSGSGGTGLFPSSSSSTTSDRLGSELDLLTLSTLNNSITMNNMRVSPHTSPRQRSESIVAETDPVYYSPGTAPAGVSGGSGTSFTSGMGGVSGGGSSHSSGSGSSSSSYNPPIDSTPGGRSSSIRSSRGSFDFTNKVVGSPIVGNSNNNSNNSSTTHSTSDNNITGGGNLIRIPSSQLLPPSIDSELRHSNNNISNNSNSNNNNSTYGGMTFLSQLNNSTSNNNSNINNNNNSSNNSNMKSSSTHNNPNPNIQYINPKLRNNTAANAGGHTTTNITTTTSDESKFKANFQHQPQSVPINHNPYNNNNNHHNTNTTYMNPYQQQQQQLQQQQQQQQLQHIQAHQGFDSYTDKSMFVFLQQPSPPLLMTADTQLTPRSADGSGSGDSASGNGSAMPMPAYQMMTIANQQQYHDYMRVQSPTFQVVEPTSVTGSTGGSGESVTSPKGSGKTRGTLAVTTTGGQVVQNGIGLINLIPTTQPVPLTASQQQQHFNMFNFTQQPSPAPVSPHSPHSQTLTQQQQPQPTQTQYYPPQALSLMQHHPLSPYPYQQQSSISPHITPSMTAWTDMISQQQQQQQQPTQYLYPQQQHQQSMYAPHQYQQYQHYQPYYHPQLSPHQIQQQFQHHFAYTTTPPPMNTADIHNYINQPAATASSMSSSISPPLSNDNNDVHDNFSDAAVDVSSLGGVAATDTSTTSRSSTTTASSIINSNNSNSNSNNSSGGGVVVRELNMNSAEFFPSAFSSSAATR